MGGSGGTITSVKLFQVMNRTWCEVTDLPQSLICPSAKVCGNLIHMGMAFHVLLKILPSSDEPTTSQLRSHTILSRSRLLPLPVRASKASTRCGEQGGLSVNSIHQLVDRLALCLVIGGCVSITRQDHDSW